MKFWSAFFLVFLMLFGLSQAAFAKETEEKSKEKDEYAVPDHVLNIGKENTYPNSGEDQEVVEPSGSTKELLDDLDMDIDNPELIKLLNESDIDPSPIGFGYRGMVYIGRWALNYESEDTTINWEYQHVNTNELNNIGGDTGQKMSYNQNEQKDVKGALTGKISDAEDVKRMMLMKAAHKTKLSLAFQTTIGKNTKKGNSYNIPVKKAAELQAYAPAVSEKGQVTFGEVYFQLKGTKKSLVIKNVTKQGIGAWIPIEDHLSFAFQLN
nr:YfkD family protein [Lentibacillus sp. JNUCC-1]